MIPVLPAPTKSRNMAQVATKVWALPHGGSHMPMTNRRWENPD